MHIERLQCSAGCELGICGVHGSTIDEEKKNRNSTGEPDLLTRAYLVMFAVRALTGGKRPRLSGVDATTNVRMLAGARTYGPSHRRRNMIKSQTT